MASYASVAELREMLPQVPASTTTDVLLGELLERATRLVEGELTFEYAPWDGAATAKDFHVRVVESQYLQLPDYQAGTLASIYEVTAKGTTYEDTEEVTATAYDILDDGRLFRYEGWPSGWYRATAVWGVGPAPSSVVQVVLEIAVNLWRGRDRGMFSDVIGVDGGGAVGYARSLTNQQRMVLQNERARALKFGVA